MPKITVFQVPFTSTRTDLPLLSKDALIREANGSGSVRAVIDLGDETGYSSLVASPPNGTALNNLTGESSVNANVVVTATGQLTYAGGGLDLSSTTGAGQFVQISNALAGIFSNQNFLITAYYKLPTLANWNTSATISTLADAGTFNVGADLLNINMTNGPAVTFRRQNGAGPSVQTFTVNLDASDYGKLAQLAFYRTSAGQAALVRTSLENIRWSTSNVGGVLAARGIDNPQDFSANATRVGRASFSTGAAPNGYSGLKLYRFFLVNMNLDNRDPLTLLNRDWARVVSRGQFV
ncbi:MAG: hypothetical protein HEQ19_13965 [Gloeotrichia echinulata CP02]|jgi:hypothetical protein|nr:hypothetical protein [Gloeotrichia echinulata DEX184]